MFLFKPCWILSNRCRHAGKHAGTGVMPVIINKNKMTNQSGNDDKQLADQRVPAERWAGVVSASTRDRADFHNTSAGILHIANVLASQHVSCCCSS